MTDSGVAGVGAGQPSASTPARARRRTRKAPVVASKPPVEATTPDTASDDPTLTPKPAPLPVEVLPALASAEVVGSFFRWTDDNGASKHAHKGMTVKAPNEVIERGRAQGLLA